MLRTCAFLLFVCAVSAFDPVVVNRGDPSGILPIDAKECTNGPTYWCQDIRTAKQCGATKHCIQTVWEHMKVPEDDGDVCKICKEMVQEARDNLESNETQELIKEVFDGSCNLIPLKIISRECRQLADEFIPQLIEFLVSNMNPQVVCSVSGLCNNARNDVLMRDYKKLQKAAEPKLGSALYSPECHRCISTVDESATRLNAATPEQFRDAVMEVCGRIGSLSDSCRAVVADSYVDLYNGLQINLKGKELCSLFGTCYEINKPEDMPVDDNIVELSGKGTDLSCSFCKQMVNHLKNILTMNTTEEEFYQVLLGLCKQTGKYADQCSSIVEEYYHQLYEYLINDLDPAEACTIVGVCRMTVGYNGNKDPIWYLRPAKTPQIALTVADAVVGTGEDYAHPKKSQNTLSHVEIPSSNVGIKATSLQPAQSMQLPLQRLLPAAVESMGDKNVCYVCQFILHYLQDTLSRPSTEEEIKHAVQFVCDHLPGTIKTECSEFVNTYGDAVISLLVQEVDPSLVCPELRLCPGGQMLESINPAPAAEAVRSTLPCVACEYFVHLAQEKLSEKATKQEIRNELKKLCGRFRGTIKSDCDIFIHDYVEDLIEVISVGFTPEEACTYFMLCQAKQTATDIQTNDIPPMDPSDMQLPVSRLMPVPVIKVGLQQKKLNDPSPTCVMCEYAMSELEQLLKNNATEEEIKETVEHLCSYLPQSVYQECKAFVDEYGDAVIQMLIEELAPNVICTHLGLCSGKSTKEVFSSVEVTNVKTTLEKLPMGTCKFCEMIVHYLEKLLQDESMEEKFDEALIKVCVLVPKEYRLECEEVINTYGPYLLSILGQLSGENVICQAVELCPQPPGQVKLLGGEKCTWGPAYWCKSTFHAKSCNALEHCRKRVWAKQGKN